MDIATLNSSCKHVYHLLCYVECFLADPNTPCRACDSDNVKNVKLWDNPLEVKDGSLAAGGESEGLSLMSPLRAIASFVSQRLDSAIDTSKKALLLQDLPVATLQAQGCTADALLKELGTRLFDLLLKTRYSPENLRTLGFTWEALLLSGMSLRHIDEARRVFGDAFFSELVGSVPHFISLCSNDISKFPLKPSEWALLDPFPALALAKANFKAIHLIPLGFTMKEWSDHMKLDQLLMKQHFKFRTEDYLLFVNHDFATAQEFRLYFKFDPFSNFFGQNEQRRPLAQLRKSPW